MNVSDVMSKDIETITKEESLYDAALKMKKVDAGVLPVMDGGGEVVGVLTDRDIITRGIAEGADPKLTQVEKAMTRDVVSCRPDCPLEAAAETMRDRKIRRLLVTEEHNKNPVGILSLGDIAVRTDEKEMVGASTEDICQPCG